MPDLRKRALSALIAAALIVTVAALPSCGIIIINDGSETAADTSESTQEQTSAGQSSDVTTATSDTYRRVTTGDAKAGAESALDKITQRDFDGISIFIASTEPDRFAPSSVDDDVSEARYTRRTLVEDKLNTTVMTISGTSDQIFEDLRTDEKAGIYYADIIAVPLPELGKFITAGLLLRLSSLPFLDLTADWFNADGMTQATAGSSSAYTVIGDLNLEPGDLYSVFWNKTLAASVSAGNLYKLTYNGLWTWDYMLTCARAIADVDTGMYGLASTVDAESLISAFYAASGERLFDTGSDGALSAAFGSDRASAVAEKLKKFFAPDVNPLGSASDVPTSQGVNAFYAGNSAFIVTPLGTAGWFTNMKSNWGILPLPKYEEAQESYYSYLDGDGLSFSTPSDNESIDTAGVFISAFAAATGDLISDAFCNGMIKYVIRDDDSLNMMDIIRGSATVGFADIFGSGYDVIANGASGSLYNAVRGKATLGYYYRYYSKTLDAQVRKFT